MTTRTFLAIDIKPDIKKEISKTIKEFKEINPNIKYVNPENIHITLKFFGNLNDEKIEEIKTIINKVTTNYEPFKIDINGMGAFPNTNHIKVIWIGIKENPILESLQETLDKEFSKIGFKKEENYKTHLTIGRMKTAKGKKQIQEKIEENKNIQISELKIETLHLKKSTLTPKGPIYEDIEVFNL